jgi:hypothetical protein
MVAPLVALVVVWPAGRSNLKQIAGTQVYFLVAVDCRER